jgi:hypothetical protein
MNECNKNITVFGTCRITNISKNNQLCEHTTYTHSTKEIIQLYKFLNGEISIKHPYDTLCFRSAIVYKTPIKFSSTFKSKLNNSDAFVVEIPSRKKYIHQNHYLHHLCVDKRFDFYKKTEESFLKEYVVEIQSDIEIENDILDIQKMVYPKPLIIVSHYNSVMNGSFIKDRNNLIILLQTICQKYQIPFINPTEILKNYNQNIVMSEDFGHYTNFGKSKMVEYIDDYINTNIYTK